MHGNPNNNHCRDLLYLKFDSFLAILTLDFYIYPN